MRRELLRQIYGKMITSSMFFLGIEHNREALMKVCLELRATAALEDDDIYQEGEIGDEMYFLHDGGVVRITRVSFQR
jgi:hypothetical protein